ncbi:MAG TPA: PQQ-binding-like beta-propeller repeat protein, partial [Vicinamibacterales bacterium]|nr:PQQ-binding-like beta-propeller repeat protein [Vicinamibacterales bacterium]
MKRILIAFVLAVPLAAQAPVPRGIDAADWPMYSGSYRSERFSPLTEITPSNVAKLHPVWVYQPPGAGSLETTPVVVNGMMYVTAGPTMVAALDLKSGKSLWEWTRPIPPSVLNLGFPRVNRGVAVLDNTVFVGTLDGYLFALDARAGIERWSVHVGDNKFGHSITAAPLVVGGNVIVGVSGGEAGIRGFLDAYDAKTGQLAWRFWTIPSPGEPGSDTWPGDSWVHGGGATWLTGSYDPALNLIYWGTGNPGPDWNGDARIGDNLYTSSLVAIDATTGRARWHFQFTPHDTHDWDANQIPVLVDAEINGRMRQLVVQANRNAFFYVLDRETGEYILGAP